MSVPRDQVRPLVRAADKEQKARDEKEQLIITAYRDGGSYREIALLVGLSHSKVREIVMAAGADRNPIS